MPRFIFIVGAAVVLIGCTTSKWAIDDPDYRKKYGRPYAPGEKIPRIIKQAVDARHLNDKGGSSIGFAGANAPFHAGAELGLFTYGEPWLEGRVALAGLLSEPGEGFFGGVSTGIRIQSPSRVAPFGGIGIFAGYAKRDVVADTDGRDNNDNLIVDEKGELGEKTFGFLSVYPEVGLHVWLTSRCRLTSSVSYHVSTEGRDADFVFYGVALAFLSRTDPAAAQGCDEECAEFRTDYDQDQEVIRTDAAAAVAARLERIKDEGEAFLDRYDSGHGSKKRQVPLCEAPDHPSVGARPFRQRNLTPF